jgi:hypothetical protein
MYAQADIDGNQYLLLSEIIDHKSDGNTVHADDSHFTTPTGREKIRRTTKGWKLCVKWKDESTTWEDLKDLKESNPVQVAEYAVTNKIVSQPAFAWWVPFTLKKRDRIIAKVNTRYLKRTHKFGIEVPKSVAHAMRLDVKNGNSFWEEAIAKEMKDVKVAFKVLDEKAHELVNYQFMKCHIIFDVKMEDFRRKARLVAGGHMTDPPAAATYASVVSRKLVRIALTAAALNDLDLLAADIQNAYLNAPITEKVWKILGAEFGHDLQGRKAIIVRALYGLKSAGAAFWNHLAVCMQGLDYKSCLADPDVWMRARIRDDGFEFYEYVLIYVDDILCISDNPQESLERIDKYFSMKQNSIGRPDIYLGAKLSGVRLPNQIEAWAMSPSKYIQEACKNAKQWHKENQPQSSYPSKCTAPFSTKYRPECDATPELEPEEASYFQSIIGVLRWAVKLGRIDITAEVSMLSSHLALPRDGHLAQAFHIFAYLEPRHASRLVFDPTYPHIDESLFNA